MFSLLEYEILIILSIVKKRSENMSKPNFFHHVETLKDELDDIIIYMENAGKINELFYQIRSELDDQDPFVKINATIAAQLLISQSKTIH